MRHTFISWDCCYRNFHHLIASLAHQDYPKDLYELIFVEQRSRKCSDELSHKLNLMSLYDTAQEFKDKMNISVFFMDIENAVPYHLGICNNEGLEKAKGKYISVMDGDLLVKPNFIQELDCAHSKDRAVINLDRRYALQPVGVELSNWMEGIIDFGLCLEMCSDKDREVPDEVTNKGPMISAPKESWLAVGGYDLHRIWSTGVSRLGQDVTARLEIYSGCKSWALNGQFCVHPYHPAGFSRDGYVEAKVLDLQQKLINWCCKNNEYRHSSRIGFTEAVYSQNLRTIESNISGKGNWQDSIRHLCAMGMGAINSMFNREPER